MARKAGTSYRRAKHLVCYWESDRFIVHNYATSARVALDPVLLRVIALAGRRTTAGEIARHFPGVSSDVIQATLEELKRRTFVIDPDARPDDRERSLREWEAWEPEAAFFHMSVRDTDFTPPEVADRRFREKEDTGAPPPLVKRIPGAPGVALPKGLRSNALAQVLLKRRTWRRFGRRAITPVELATLLELTWGVQHWIEGAKRSTRAALKTAPSGGARHSIEAYVLVRRVEGLRPGLYHYDSDGHRLRRIGRGGRVPQITDYVPHQTWYRPAAALVLMTAVFARAQWRYPYSRAYRSVLYEAGHHCQNFLLLATALGLAPFCTGALADSRIEADLGIDGVSEAVLYACGVGTRPAGAEWAPWPNPASTPKLSPPRWRRRSAAASR